MTLLGFTTVSPSPLLPTLDLHVHEAEALLAPATTMTDVFFGLYQWLNEHPTEAVLVSINHESGTGTPYDAKIQEMVYDIINSDIGEKYWVQTSGSVRSLLFYFDCGAQWETVAGNAWTSPRKTNPPPTIYIRPLTRIQDQTDRYPT
jgi:hypothetical protein